MTISIVDERILPGGGTIAFRIGQRLTLRRTDGGILASIERIAASCDGEPARCAAFLRATVPGIGQVARVALARDGTPLMPTADSAGPAAAEVAEAMRFAGCAMLRIGPLAGCPGLDPAAGAVVTGMSAQVIAIEERQRGTMPDGGLIDRQAWLTVDRASGLVVAARTQVRVALPDARRPTGAASTGAATLVSTRRWTLAL